MQEYTSKTTSINKEKVPKLFQKVEWKKGTKNLDYGAGKWCSATLYLSWRDVTNYSYDPFNRSEEDNNKALSAAPFDTITLSNVLNVIKEEHIRKDVIRHCLTLLKPNGELYISVYPGNGSGEGKCSKKDCWQNNQPIDFYYNEVASIDEVIYAEMCKGVITIVNEIR